MHRNKRNRLLWFQNLPRSLQGLLLAASIAFVIGGISSLGLFDALEQGLLDGLFRARGPLADPDPAVVLVVVDDPTVTAINRWPLPRRYYADLVDRIGRAGAKTIAFDFVFSTPSDNPFDDDNLESACRAMGHVVPAAVFDMHRDGGYGGSSNPAQPVIMAGDSHFFKAGFAVTDHGATCLSADEVTTALPALDESASAIGHINVFPETDGKLRKIPNVMRYRGNLYPSLAVAATADYLNLRPHDIVTTARAVHIAGRTLPLDRFGETWVNWTGGNNSFPTYSMGDVLKGRVPPDRFRGKLVLIGSTTAGAYEFHATPYSPSQPAVELQANAIDNILHNRPLRELPVNLRWLLAILFPVLCGTIIAPRSAASGTLFIFGLCGILFVSLLIAFTQNLYIPAVAPLLSAALAYAAVTALNYRREWESNFQVDAAVATLARGGALMASGSDRSTIITVIQRTAKTALGAFEVFVLLDDTDGDFLLHSTAERLAATRGSLLWPNRTVTTASGGAESAEAARLLDELLQQVCMRVETEQHANRHQTAGAFRTLVAAPIHFSSGLSQRNGVGDEDLESAHGILLAVGRRGGGVFTQRDLTLLETLAEQAGMALKNLAYYERLQGRIELANRDLRQAYQLLAEQSAKLAAAVESISDALIVTDAAGNAIFLNNASGRILSGAVPELGESVPVSLRAHGFGELADLFVQASLHDDPTESFQCELVHGTSDTQRRMLAATLTPLQYGDGSPLGAMLVVTDITAQRQLEQMKTDFVSYVAHELRTPLTTILGYASLLQESGDQFPQQQRAEMASAIMNHCQRLNRMITEMLDIARLDAGQALSLRAAHFDLGQLAESVVTAQRAGLRGPRQHNLRLDTPDDPIIVEADRDRVEQMLTNLLSNAIKYSPDGGEIELRLADSGDSVEFSVSDTGIGMTDDQVSRLFQKFYRATDAMARGIKGTGLGLFLVKQLVEGHHGRIEVTSSAGSGSTFTVTLPKHSSSFTNSETEMVATVEPIPVVR